MASLLIMFPPHQLSGTSWFCWSFLCSLTSCVCGWDNRADARLDHILSPSSRLAWRLGRVPRVETCEGSCSLSPELQQSHFCWVLLTEASHKAFSDSREEETDFTSRSEKLKSHLTQGVDPGRSEGFGHFCNQLHLGYHTIRTTLWFKLWTQKSATETQKIPALPFTGQVVLSSWNLNHLTCKVITVTTLSCNHEW